MTKTRSLYFPKTSPRGVDIGVGAVYALDCGKFRAEAYCGRPCVERDDEEAAMAAFFDAWASCGGEACCMWSRPAGSQNVDAMAVPIRTFARSNA